MHIQEKINVIKKFEIKFFKENDREPSNKEIAKALTETEDTIIKYKKASQDVASLNVAIGNTEDITLMDFITDNVIMEDKILTKICEEELFNLMKENLSEKEILVLNYRFGLIDDRPKTLQEIGTELNLTRERVRQIEIKTLRKLRFLISRDPELKKAYKERLY